MRLNNIKYLRFHLTDQCIVIDKSEKRCKEVINKDLFRSVMLNYRHSRQMLDILFNNHPHIICSFCQSFWNKGSKFVFNGYYNKWFDFEPEDLF